MKKSKILVLLGHPDSSSANGRFADAYERGARESGHEVRRKNAGDLKFDPILHKGYKIIQPLEPDLVELQEDIKWCEHLVIIYPNWFVTMPAILKGLFDRMWLPGFAYYFPKNSMIPRKLLKGRSARVICTLDFIPWIERMALGNYTNEIRRAILGFAGFRPVRLMKIGSMKNMNEKRWVRIQKKLYNLGQKAK